MIQNPLSNEVLLFGKPYQNGDWIKIAVHNKEEIKGFFGDYSWLSNFHLCSVYQNSYAFKSSEHAYMFAKLNLDHYAQTEVENFYTQVKNMSCKEVKKWGQSIVLREDWEIVKYEAMASIIFDKFYRNKDLREKLLQTENRYLEETNWWNDQFWGVDYLNGGQNNLGKILMKVRSFWYVK